MSSNVEYCGPCQYEQKRSDATKWCSNCNEGLCQDCVRSHKAIKLLRNHQIISIDAHQNLSNVSINIICENHDKKFDLYCKSHDMVLCLSCVSSNHKQCSDIIPIEDAAKNSRQSTALFHLEQRITETQSHVKQCIYDREQVLKDIEDQEREIREAIQENRATINKRLDQLEEKLLIELKDKYNTCKSNYSQVLKKLYSTKTNIDNLQEQMKQLKQDAADLQVFLGTLQINKAFVDEFNITRQFVQSSCTYKMELRLDHRMAWVLDDIDRLGEVEVHEFSAQLQFTEAKCDQAQAQVRALVSPLDSAQLQLKQKFDIETKFKLQSVSGCLVLCGGTILVADYFETETLREYTNMGDYVREIAVSGAPFALALIDSSHVGVTFGKTKNLQIVDLEQSKVDKAVKFQNSCWGVSYHEEKFYVIVFTEGIVVLDISGEILNVLNCNVNMVQYLTFANDKIYISDGRTDEVVCYNTAGKVIWKFNNERIVNPKGITTDNNHNVFVVGTISRNLTMIQYDGTASKVLLTAKDELWDPTAVHYNKHKKTLVLGYKCGGVALYGCT